MIRQVDTLWIAADERVFAARAKEGGRPVAAGEIPHRARGEELAARVRALGERLFDGAFLDRHLHAVWDRADTDTLFVESSLDSFTQEFFDGTRTILADFPGWRVQAGVLGVPLNGRTTVGCILLFGEDVLIDRALYGVFRWRGFDFRCQRVEFATAAVR